MGKSEMGSPAPAQLLDSGLCGLSLVAGYYRIAGDPAQLRHRIWRDASEAARLSEFDVEAKLGGRVQGIDFRSNAPGTELMHLKGYCVDHRLLRTGSANFSRSGETRQDNDLVALRGASICAGFDAKFDRAWARS
jgi:phosphatidylserine/phosphatidylglycerophosphate/cardiolipin synthase-like enzyme